VINFCVSVKGSKLEAGFYLEMQEWMVDSGREIPADTVRLASQGTDDALAMYSRNDENSIQNYVDFRGDFVNVLRKPHENVS
jgi:hypothetical protein